jgi:VWFA-related protein
VDEVNLAFTVTDKRGHFINNLAAEDFAIKDNQLAPQQLKYFQQQSELPMRVGMLIDCSDSIRYRFNFEQHAAEGFLKRVLRAGKDQAMVVTFNSSVHLVRDMSEDFRDLSKAVKNISVGGNTALYDAIVFAAAKLQSSPPETRKAIILITDGEDTGSRALLYDAEQAAVRAQVTLFALSTNDLQLNPYPKGEAVLDLLSQPSGGRVLPAHDEVQLGRSFRMVEKALRNQYALAYQPPEFKADGTFRKIEVVPRKKGLVVQCRRGYYARREEAANQRALSSH